MQTIIPARAADKWAVVNTHANRESLAVENLARQGFEPYCPQIRKLIRHARRNTEQLRPLFPGYLFVRVDIGRWRPILSTLGVRSIVCHGERPSLVGTDLIDALRAREVDGVVERPERPFSVGQQVQMSGGPFDGFTATVVCLNEKDRISVLLDLLMRSVRVNVTERQVTAA